MSDVKNAKAKILNTIFFDQNCVEEKIKDRKKFASYLKSQLEKGVRLFDLINPVIEMINENFIYGGLSFYDHYHDEWVKDYLKFKPGNANYPKVIEDMMTQYKRHKDSFILMTTLVVEHRSHYRSLNEGVSVNSNNEDNPSHGSCILHIVKKKIYYKEYKVELPGFNNGIDIANIGLSSTTSCCKKNDQLLFCESLSKYEIDLEGKNIVKLIGDLDIKEPENKEKLCNLFRFFAYQRDTLGLKYLYCFTPTSVVPAGIIFLNLKKELSDEYIDFFQTLSNQLFLQLSLGMSIAKAKDDLKRHATRAAAAAIIGRNISHNIGSHVIYYLSNSFQNSDRNPFDKILKEFIGKCEQETKLDFQRILKDFEDNDKVNTFEKLYNNISTFLNYIQARMDYVALAGTIEPGYGQGMKIKDLMEEFKNNKFLIDGIAQSEDVKAIEIKEKKSSFQGLVTVPFGEIGKHAFFSILENIIRNSAKHGHDKIKDGKLSLYYSVKEETNNGRKYIVLEIYDELNTWEKAEQAMHLSKDNEQSATKSPLIDDNGSLVHAYMGIKEMKISAAFLRMIPFYEIDSEKYKKNRLLELDPRNDSLMYKIRLLPYKNLLIVTDGKEGLPFVNEEYCEEYGLDKASIEYLEKENEHIDEYKIAVSNLQLDGLKEEIKNKLPNRLVYCKDISNKSFNDTTILDVYRKWIEKIYCIDDLNKKNIYYEPSGGENKEDLKKKWAGLLFVEENISDCHVRFQGHLDEFQHYVYAYGEKMKGDFEIAEDVSKRSHILKERLNNPSEKKFDKQLFRLELLESAFSRVLIVDERLFSDYQCHWHDFEINRKEYRINYGNKVLPDQEDERKTFNFPYKEFIEIGKWLRKEKKELKDVTFCYDSKELKCVNEYIKNKILCINEGVSEIIKDCIKHVSLQKLVEHIKFLYEKRKDYYRFYLKNIEIGNISTTKENNKVSFINIDGDPLFSLEKDGNGNLSLDRNNEALNKFHFFSLHLGIIDKIRETLSCSESDIIRVFDSSLKKTYFILHTGRGKTLQTNDYPVRFMDFTTLNNWVNGSKWMFVQGLYSIKKQIYE